MFAARPAEEHKSYFVLQRLKAKDLSPFCVFQVRCSQSDITETEPVLSSRDTEPESDCDNKPKPNRLLRTLFSLRRTVDYRNHLHIQTDSLLLCSLTN